jgi:hypothetical protein
MKEGEDIGYEKQRKMRFQKTSGSSTNFGAQRG